MLISRMELGSLYRKDFFSYKGESAYNIYNTMSSRVEKISLERDSLPGILAK
jgi:hypothetical protein